MIWMGFYFRIVGSIVVAEYKIPNRILIMVTVAYPLGGIINDLNRFANL